MTEPQMQFFLRALGFVVVALLVCVAGLALWLRRNVLLQPRLSAAEFTNLQQQLTVQEGRQHDIQNQNFEQWQRANALEAKVTVLERENQAFRETIKEQNQLIKALQRRLSGWVENSASISRKLRTVLTKGLDETELRQWCSDLAPPVPFDALQGATTPALIISLLAYLERYGRMDEALDNLRISRPDIITNGLT